MLYYNFLCGLLINIILTVVSANGMEQRYAPENLLVSLQEDAKKGIVYPQGYFQPIANEIDDLEQHLKRHYSSSDFSLLNEYEKQLKFHAKKYIQQLIQNPSYSPQEKLQQLENYFPKNDPTLLEYWYEGQQKINPQRIQSRQKSDTKQIQSIALYKKLEEDEKKTLLREIMSYKPTLHREETLDFSIYTSDYFHAQKNEQQKEKDAIIYIKYVINNNDWPDIDDKLKRIEGFLGQDTKFYLLKTLDSITVILLSKRPKEKEIVPARGRVTEVTEEEIKETPKIRVPGRIIEEKQVDFQHPYRKDLKKQSPVAEVKSEHIVQQPEPSSPNIFYQAATFVWQSITGFFSYIYTGATNVLRAIRGNG